MLLLSGTWTAWRKDFRPAGEALAVLAVFGGMMFLSLYLLWLSVQTRGDVRVMLLGKTRVRA